MSCILMLWSHNVSLPQWRHEVCIKQLNTCIQSSLELFKFPWPQELLKQHPGCRCTSLVVTSKDGCIASVYSRCNSFQWRVVTKQLYRNLAADYVAFTLGAISGLGVQSYCVMASWFGKQNPSLRKCIWCRPQHGMIGANPRSPDYLRKQHTIVKKKKQINLQSLMSKLMATVTWNNSLRGHDKEKT